MTKKFGIKFPPWLNIQKKFIDIYSILDVIEYEPDADMIFNYLMVSALASATELIEREGLKPSGGNLDILLTALAFMRVWVRVIKHCMIS